MSYCRFTDDSDVYAYWCDGGVKFWVAGRDNKGLDRLCNTFNEAYQYAKSLRDEHGLDVPDSAIDALKADALDEAKRMCGPKSAVAELQAENAKLRELLQGVAICASGKYCYGCPHQYDWCDRDERLRAEGIEVDG